MKLYEIDESLWNKGINSADERVLYFKLVDKDQLNLTPDFILI
jgi:hypothetical protein